MLQEVLQDIRAHPYEESAKGTRLGCQLRLLAVLIKVLEPDCVGNMSIKCEGPAREGDLVRFLMKGASTSLLYYGLRFVVMNYWVEYCCISQRP